jgi:hypothetical protein
VKLVNLIKFWIKWSSFWGGVAALRGIKKSSSRLLRLLIFVFVKLNLKKKFKANFLGDLLIKIQILKLKELKF